MFLYSKTLPTKVVNNATVPGDIQIRMLAEDPLEAYLFSNTSNVDIFELEFPLEEALVDVVVDITTKELVEMFKSQQVDTKNNSEDEKFTR